MIPSRHAEPPPGPAPFYLSPIGAAADLSCSSAVAEPALLPRRPTLGLVHHGMGVVRHPRGETRVDASQVALLNGGRFRLHPVACTGSPCATTLTLSAFATRALARRSRLSEPEVLRLFSAQPSLCGPVIQREIHVLIQAVRAHAGRGGEEIDERWLDLFTSAVRLARREPAAAPARRGAVDRVRLVLSTRMEEPPHLAELAVTAGCTRSHLCRVFKQETGLTILQYLHRLRLSRAVHRLTAGPEDLSTLAVELGYASHSHFTSRFRRCYGVTPSAFRREVERAGRFPISARPASLR